MRAIAAARQSAGTAHSCSSWPGSISTTTATTKEQLGPMAHLHNQIAPTHRHSPGFPSTSKNTTDMAINNDDSFTFTVGKLGASEGSFIHRGEVSLSLRADWMRCLNRCGHGHPHRRPRFPGMYLLVLRTSRRVHVCIRAHAFLLLHRSSSLRCCYLKASPPAPWSTSEFCATITKNSANDTNSCSSKKTSSLHSASRLLNLQTCVCVTLPRPA